MVSVEQANEIVAKMWELETEQNLMKDLFNRALRMSQSSGEGKLNFRHAERHMPGMFNGKATEYTEYIFKMEAYMSTLDPAGKGGEILRAAATEVKDMDDAEVACHEARFSGAKAALGGARGKKWRWQRARLATCLASRSTRSTRPLFAGMLWYFRFPTARTILHASVGSASAQL